jgi:hypothetical protein
VARQPVRYVKAIRNLLGRIISLDLRLLTALLKLLMYSSILPLQELSVVFIKSLDIINLLLNPLALYRVLKVC